MPETPSPQISVIIPFHDPRGHPENVAGWTQEQLLAAEDFEVLVVTDDVAERETVSAFGASAASCDNFISLVESDPDLRLERIVDLSEHEPDGQVAPW